MNDSAHTEEQRGRARAELQEALYELKRVIVGQDAMLERLLVSLLASGHVLLEGVPGLAKTLTVKTLAAVLGGSYSRIQFTPDLVPADLLGTRVYRPSTGAFDTELGPVFSNFLLADEINRAPAKVQSALLEAMQEQQVTIGGTSFSVPLPFIVMATQNPIESEGTYPLPEAQVDRFMMKVLVGYPSEREEFVIVQRMTNPLLTIEQVVSTEQLLDLQKQADAVYADPALIEFAVRMVSASRQPQQYGLSDLSKYIMYGASPRASINLILTARALAFVRWRDYLLPPDALSMSRDVRRHWLVFSY